MTPKIVRDLRKKWECKPGCRACEIAAEYARDLVADAGVAMCAAHNRLEDMATTIEKSEKTR